MKRLEQPSARKNIPRVRDAILEIPFFGARLAAFYRKLRPNKKELIFDSSAKYWETRYALGKSSGSGSYGRLAAFKAAVLNQFIADNNIRRVVELGSGDGAQIRLMNYDEYVGIDVSRSAIDRCKNTFRDDPTKKFLHSSDIDKISDYPADFALSLDVIYHLVEDDTFDAYMRQLTSLSKRYICIYSSNFDAPPVAHVRHRCFMAWMEKHAPLWKLKSHIPNIYPFEEAAPDTTSWADFYFFFAPSQGD